MQSIAKSRQESRSRAGTPLTAANASRPIPPARTASPASHVRFAQPPSSLDVIEAPSPRHARPPLLAQVPSPR